MEKWPKRYSKLMTNLTHYSNSYAAHWQREVYKGCGLDLSTAEMQIFECICTDEAQSRKMTELAMDLGVPKSTFSRYIKSMCEKGLIEKYHTDYNQKDYLLRATELGKAAHDEYNEHIFHNVFNRLFESLDNIPDEYIDMFAEAVRKWADSANNDAANG